MNKYVTNLTLPNGTNVLIKDSECRTNLSNEITRATKKETWLQTNIDTVENAREQADTTLQHNINAEASAREQADTTLQHNINAEASARKQADTTLQNKINEESSRAKSAESEIIKKLSPVEMVFIAINGPQTVLRITLSDVTHDRYSLFIFGDGNGNPYYGILYFDRFNNGKMIRTNSSDTSNFNISVNKVNNEVTLTFPTIAIYDTMHIIFNRDSIIEIK